MNIVGSGLIASCFMNYDLGKDVTIFASGVSNSQETNRSEFLRELNLLKRWLSNSRRLVYFSTCSVGVDSLKESPYVLHKIQMEKLVLLKPNGIVVRLPQVVGKSANKHTLTNFLATKIYNNESYDLYCGALRNLIDIGDIFTLTKYLLESDVEDNLFSFALPFYYEVSEIVSVFEKLLNRVSKHNSKKGYATQYPKSDFVQNAIDNEIISFDADYLEATLNRHYFDFSDRVKQFS